MNAAAGSAGLRAGLGARRGHGASHALARAGLAAGAACRCGGGFAALRILLLVLLIAVPAALSAQDKQSLADIRADLDALGGEIASLRQELVASGSAGGTGLAGSALDRMNAIEQALAQLTAKTEALELRINRVVSDGTNRLGDLEFRLCEIEPGCDISQLGQTPTLGGGAAGGAAPAIPAGAGTPAVPPASGGELAVGEKSDFDRAQAVLDQGDFQRAADLLATFAETYPGSPLMSEAHFLRGQALKQVGDTAGAARAWLAAFSEAPQGPRAADALVNLGSALGDLGQGAEACMTLGEVPVRYPGSAAASLALKEQARLGCS